MSPQLSVTEKVSFHGDTIEVARVGNKGYAHLKAMCASLGVSYTTQYRKLREAAWGGVLIMSTPDERGRTQRLAMIPLDAVPMWLATIHPAKVAFEVRVKLEVYQVEAGKVLAAWFHGPISERLARMAALDRELEALRCQVARLTTLADNSAVFMNYERRKRLESDAKLADLAMTLDTVMKPFQSHGGDYLTVRDFCVKYAVMNEPGRPIQASRYPSIGKRLTAMSAHARLPVHRAADDHGRLVGLYRLDILSAWRSDHDFRNVVPTKA